MNQRSDKPTSVHRALNRILQENLTRWHLDVGSHPALHAYHEVGDAYSDLNESEFASYRYDSLPCEARIHFFVHPEGFMAVEVTMPDPSFDKLNKTAQHIANGLNIRLGFHAIKPPCSAIYALDMQTYTAQIMNRQAIGASAVIGGKRVWVSADPEKAAQLEAAKTVVRDYVNALIEHPDIEVMTSFAEHNTIIWGRTTNESIIEPGNTYVHWSEAAGEDPNHPFKMGVKDYRFEDNPMEIVALNTFHEFHCHANRDTGGNNQYRYLEAIRRIAEGRTGTAPTDRDVGVINGTIQWLGTPVGQGFVARLVANGVAESYFTSKVELRP